MGDGGDHGGKGHIFGKEVCGAVERGETRAFASADPQRKEPGEAAIARILLKADVSEAGEGWSDSRNIQASSMIYRVRKQLVEEGFEAVLSRKRRMTPPVAVIFDGEKGAKLIALACSKPPKGRARWTLRLLESKVIELGIVERASDLTIGRTLKKMSQAASQAMLGHPAEGQTAPS